MPTNAIHSESVMNTKSSSSNLFHWMKRKTAVFGLTLLVSAGNAVAVIHTEHVQPEQISKALLTYAPKVEGATGLMRRMSGGVAVSTFSAAVVSHPKVLLTCAHGVYKDKLWVPAANLSFTAAHYAAGL